MKSETAIIIIIICVCLAFGILILVANEEGYGRGQIDAINGNIKYHLVTQPDSTKTWEKIK